jgi:hypothetical protein
VLPLAACGGGAGDDAADGETAAGADGAGDTSDSDAGPATGAGTGTGTGEPTSSSVGYAVDNEGRIAEGAAGRDFTAGDTVWVSIATEGAEAGTAVEVVWYGPEGLEAAAAEGTVEAGATHQALSADTSGWAAGTYRAEVWVGNELVDELSIEVGAGAA